MKDNGDTRGSLNASDSRGGMGGSQKDVSVRLVTSFSQRAWRNYIRCSCRKRYYKFSGNAPFGNPQLFNSCFLAGFLFTVEMTLLDLAAGTFAGLFFFFVCFFL